MTAPEVQPYLETLLETPLGKLVVEVSQPETLQVVMGASGKPEREVHQEVLLNQGVPLFKRKGGGGTVVLGPGVIVVTIHAGVEHPFRNLEYFAAINTCLIEIFNSWKPLPYSLSGISDIAVEGKKLVGTSIFRRKHYLLYQGSLLANFDLAHIDQLLKHPPKEPEYRRGRPHLEFVTNLRNLGIALPIETLMQDLKTALPKSLPSRLRNVTIEP